MQAPENINLIVGHLQDFRGDDPGNNFVAIASGQRTFIRNETIIEGNYKFVNGKFGQHIYRCRLCGKGINGVGEDYKWIVAGLNFIIADLKLKYLV